jgi:hypothetical protein
MKLRFILAIPTSFILTLIAFQIMQFLNNKHCDSITYHVINLILLGFIFFYSNYNILPKNKSKICGITALLISFIFTILEIYNQYISYVLNSDCVAILIITFVCFFVGLIFLLS